MREGFRIERLELGCEPHPIIGFSLACVVRGELRVRLAGGDSAALAAGDVLVLGLREAGALARRRGRALILLFRAPGEWLAQALALAGFEPEPAQPVAATLRAGSEAARRAARGLRELAGSAGPVAPAGAALARACLALELLAIGLSAQPEPLAPARRRTSTRGVALEAALEGLPDGPLERLTLSRFARGLGFSERQVSRLVRDRLGCSFGDYVAGLRLARAQLLLAESDLPVIEVAAEAGFGSLGHFNQRFRASTGRTPSGFRAAVRTPLARRPDLPNQARGAAGWLAATGATPDLAAEARSSAFDRASSQAEKEMLPS
jgi:AraC-like DNA-binding protein